MIISGAEAEACLFADWFAMRESEKLVIDTPAAWAGVVRRIGEAAYPFYLQCGGHAAALRIDARTAFKHGLCDSLGETRDENRSQQALESGANLITSRGGDPLERAEFARLFATGEPQEGLRAFLEKRRPRFGKSSAKPLHK
jgi:enoyl-CoA hydratase/carnithine racemase